VVSQTVPTAVNLSFLRRSRYFFKYLLNYTYEAEWAPLLTHCSSQTLLAPEIEPGTSESVARNSDHQATEVVSNENNMMRL
jgi:hypothetical protein